jgi:D-sedoheptulose 7-phosphate isomerase
LLRDAIANGGKLLLCGNGGSAADADHWAGELLKGFKSKRMLSPAARAGLPAAIADSLQGAIPAIPLTGFAALTTAFANDVDGDLTFAQLTHALGRPGDVLIGLSTSGNARNVCAAATVARVRGLRILGLTGASGGTLAPLCDICLRVPAAETFRAQEFHLPIYHCLSLMLEDDFFSADVRLS